MYTHLQQRDSDSPPVTISTLAKMKSERVPIACLTAYDASFANLVDTAGVDLVLVGDSLGMVIQGHATTVPVHPGRRGLPLRDSGARADPCIPGCRHAIPDLHAPCRGHGQCETANAGRPRQNGQAGRRRIAGRDRGVSGDARCTDLRARRTQATVGAQTRRVSCSRT